MKKIDITKQNLSICDSEEGLYVDRKRNSIVALYDYTFNPDEYFGAKINKENGYANLCFVTEWNIETGEISMYYWGEFDGSEKEETKKELDEKEQKFFKSLIEKAAYDIYDCSVLELWENRNKENEEPSDENDPFEFDLDIDLSIELSEDNAKDEKTVKQDIFSAFKDNDISYYWPDGSELEICEDTVNIKFSTSLMGEDEIEAKNFFYDILSGIESKLDKLGYKIIGIDCRITEC